MSSCSFYFPDILLLLDRQQSYQLCVLQTRYLGVSCHLWTGMHSVKSAFVSEVV